MLLKAVSQISFIMNTVKERGDKPDLKSSMNLLKVSLSSVDHAN